MANEQLSASTNPAALITRLEQSLSAELLALLRKAGHVALALDSSLYMVGGIVRDLLLGRPIVDLDLVVDGNTTELARQMQEAYGGHILKHRRFGTINWTPDKAISGLDHIDFATARTETYAHPAALPDVQPASIEQDIQRRDFTINTMALHLNPDQFCELIDLYKGYQALMQGQVTVLHAQSFIDDPTRIFRAVRFEQRFDFEIDAETRTLLEAARPLILKLSPKRILAEFEHIFGEDEPVNAMLRLNQLGVLTTIHPNLKADHWVATRQEKVRQRISETPWANQQLETGHYLGLLTFHLDQTSIQTIHHILNLPNPLAQHIRQLQAIKTEIPNLKMAQKPSDIDRLLAAYADTAIMTAWIAIDDPVVENRLIQFSEHLRHIKPTIDGRYLIDQFHLKPGPQFQQILSQLRIAKLDEQVNSFEDEHRFVENYLNTAT